MHIGVPEALISSVRKTRDFYDVGRIRQYIPEGAYENLLYLFAGTPNGLKLFHLNISNTFPQSTS